MSDNTALKVARLQIRRMPGISDPFTIDGLYPGVNVIHGPNGSGKTTTARALETAIWPQLEKDRRSVAAYFSVGATDYFVDLDAGHVAVQANGKRADVPQLPAPDFRERYQLSLHDLIAAADAGDKFALEIERQSSGGYDLTAAREDLAFRAKPSPATKELAELDNARRKLKDAQGAQAAIHEEARRLAELEKRCEESVPASARKALLDAAIDHVRARAAHADAVDRCAVFSPVHESINGTEHSALVDLTERAEKAIVNEQSEAARVRQADAEAQQAFPEGAASAELMIALREDIRALELAEQTRAGTRKDVVAADGELQEARRALGPRVTDDQLARIDADGFGDLSAFAQQAVKEAAEIAAAKAEVARAGSASAPRDLDAVRSGMEVLARWLSDGQPDGDAESSRAQRKMMLVAGAVAAVISLALALWSPGALVGVLVAAVLVLLGTRTKQPGEPSARPQRERDYARLSLASPAAWTPAAVAACLDALCRRLGDGRLAEERAAWAMEATRRVQDLEARNQKIEQQRVQLASRFGVAPDTDACHLAWMGERIGRWQSAKADYARAAASLVECERQLKELFERICARVAPFIQQSVSNMSDAKACAETLEKRIQKFESAIKTRREATARLDEAAQESADLTAQIDRLLRLDGAEPMSSAELERLCNEHKAYQAACNTRSSAENDVQKTRTALTGHTRFTDDLLQASESELEALRAEQERLIDGYGDLVREAEGLRTRVDQAKRGTDVERALAELASAEAALEAMRASDLGAMVGDTLICHLQNVARNQHRPEVFRRASEIFSTITRGRYLLDFQDSGIAGAASFRATDQVTKVGHAIGELSSATRVQLLLAVRIAFVEAQEQGGVRLPLLLDETLGTSDDVRAHAIIDAIFTLTESGRQVFYFTAQRDEVMKWKSVAQARATSVNVVDLAAIRSIIATPEAVFANLPEAMGPVVPSPEGMTRDEYAEVLKVPPVSDRSGAAAAHLWYFVDDLNVLHEFLSFGMTTWGQLSTMLTNGGLAFATEHEKVIARATASARALDVLLTQLAIGRGRSVDRAVLLGSGAVSSLKIDEVATVAEKYHGNARDLIAALEDKAVPGFQAKKAADLRAYLEREGYLDEDSPRTADEIRAAVLAAVASDVHAGTLTRADLDGLVSSLRWRCGNGQQSPESAAEVVRGETIRCS